MTQPRFVLLAVLATLAAPALAQITPEQWNNLAAGADDFMPAAPDIPLDELVNDDFLVPPEFQGQGVLDAPVAPTDSFEVPPGPAPDTAIPPPQTGPETGIGAFPAMEIPADWVEHSRLGATFRTPPDWAAQEDEDDSLFLGQLDEATRTGVSFGIALERERQFDDAPPGSVLTDLPEVELGEGVAFRHRSFVAEIEGTAMSGHLLISVQPYERDKHLMIMSAGIGGDQDAKLNLIEMALATLTVAPFPGASGQAGAAPQTGFGGLVTYALPSGWRVFSDRTDFLSFGVTPTYSGYVTIETGDYAQQTIEAGGFDGAPAVSRAEILGEPAELSTGLTSSAEVADGAAMVQGEKRIYLLDRCLSNGDPVVITMVGAPRWVASGGLEPLIAALSLTLPPEAMPCAAPSATEAPAQGITAQPGVATPPTAAIIAPVAQPTTVSPDGRVIFPAVGLGGWAGENVTLKNQHAKTGDAKPFLLAKAEDDGMVGYFVAPPALVGDWRVHGGLSAVLTTAKGAYFGAWDQGGKGDIWIANGTMTASAAFSRPIGSKATERILRFDSATWTVAGGAGSLDDVLAQVTDFRIRAEYVRGGTTAALRDIAFLPRAAAAVAEPEIWTTVGDVQTQALNSIAAVGNGPGKPSVVVFEGPTLVLSIMTYHWNSARGATPGTIALRDRAGVVYGPWNASGSDGQGGVRNAYWHVEPNISLQPGQYTIIDSDPSTWSTNSETGDRGIFEVRYQRIARAAPTTAP